MEYFLFNKTSDYKKGRTWNITAEAGGLILENPGQGQMGGWVSHILDAGESGTYWHRLCVNCTLGENMAYAVSVYGTDSLNEAGKAGKLAEEADSWKRLLELLRPWKLLDFQNPRDVLLKQAACRYLWIAVTLWGNGGGSPAVGQIQIWFPSKSWLSYLPEYYQAQKSTFLERYLTVFQTIYEEMEQDIRSSAGRLELQTEEQNQFSQLTGWLNMDNRQMWKQERLRRYLAMGAAAYGDRGTRRGLERLVECFTGEHPFIVEREDEPYRFFLFISERVVPSMKEYKTLIKVIRESVPAHMEVKLVILRPYLFLNQDSYLGINSVLGACCPAVLDGISRIPLAVLGGKTS